MINLVDRQVIGGSPENIGTIGLSRKNGIPKLFLKSPLLENYFKLISKGDILSRKDRVFGVNLYNLTLDPGVSDEFMRETGVLLQGGETFYGTGPSGQMWFNLAFLRAVGGGEGIYIPLTTMFPVKLIENGSFARAIRTGISKLLKEFIVDFDTELQFSYQTRVE